MKADMLKIQVASLVGGHMVHAEPEATLEAVGSGAVAVLTELKNVVDKSAFLDNLLSRLSVHPLCLAEDYEQFSDIYKKYKEPGHFVLAPPARAGSITRKFLVIKKESDLSSLQPDTLLVIVHHARLLSGALKRRDLVDTTIPVFVKASDKESALKSLQAGADGTLLPQEVNLEDMLDSWIDQLPPASIDASAFNIGVVSLQGDYRFHIEKLNELISDCDPDVARHLQVVEVRRGEDLAQCDAALLPGGWSNLQTILYKNTGIDRVLKSFKEQGKPILGICAGMILAGSRRGDAMEGRTPLELIDATIDNNVVNGDDLMVSVTTKNGVITTPAAFSNGPIARELGDGVEVIGQLTDPRSTPAERAGAVAAREGNVFIASCHQGPGTHDIFLSACLDAAKSTNTAADKRPTRFRRVQPSDKCPAPENSKQ